ncbi:MAG: transposase [Desulfomicrobium apsheronum]|nr:transposase [Desulfomicrobium apsheronum]
MARPLRIDFNGAWHHVMNRGRQRENIFRDAQDYKAFTDLLKSTSEMFRVNVAAYCLMSNHYHILVQSSEGNLARAMRHLGGVYTQWFNRRYGLDGQLFKGRYKAILIGEDEYLQGLIRYIHHNPLKAGLTKSLSEYPWSSHLGYLRRGDAWKWLHTETLLSQFSDDPAKARAEYRRVMARDEDEEIERIFSLKKLPAILGNSDFVQTIKDRFFVAKLSPEVPESRQLAPVTIEAIKKAVCEAHGVTENVLASSVRGITNDPRDISIYLSRILKGDSLKQIGEHFKIEKYSTVASAIARVKRKVDTDEKEAERIENIVRMIDKSQKKT